MSQTIAVQQTIEDYRQDNGQFGEQFHTPAEPHLLTIEEIEVNAAHLEAKAAGRAKAQGVLGDTTQMASYYASSRGQMQDKDDIVGETIVDIYSQMVRGAKHYDQPAFIHAATRAKSYNLLAKGIHHSGFTARGMYKAAIDEATQERGHELSTKEKEQIAEQIRLSHPASRRPTKGYHRFTEVLSLDATLDGTDDVTLGHTIADIDRTSPFATSTSKAAAYVEALEDEKSSIKARDVRKNLWNILTDDGRKAPKVAVMSVKDDRAHRKAIDEFGGPLAIARAWELGDLGEDDAAVVALFAPFGDIDAKAQEKVISLITFKPELAEQVWDSAMTSATDQAARRVAIRRDQRAEQRKAERASA